MLPAQIVLVRTQVTMFLDKNILLGSDGSRESLYTSDLGKQISLIH